jgi:hypothetical protein
MNAAPPPWREHSHTSACKSQALRAVARNRTAQLVHPITPVRRRLSDTLGGRVTSYMLDSVTRCITLVIARYCSAFEPRF